MVEVEGQVLGGKYRLERYLGSGGFASVWAARNLDLDRPVALKILADNFVRMPGAVERFSREARLASKYIHPAVLQVEDICRTGEGVPFLVMELLEGCTLDERLSTKGPIPLEECLPLVRLMLEGLAAAHELGIIHRDIKPANIFLVSSETRGAPLRILDLGLAKDIADDGSLTRTGQLMGTPDFLAPEILLNTSKELWVPTVDVFAAGMVIFAMLTGRLPFDKPSSGPVEARIADRILDYARGVALEGPREFEPTLPHSIDRFVRKSLALAPESRHQNASELLEDLDTAVAEVQEPVDAPASVSISRTPSPNPDSGALGDSIVTPMGWDSDRRPNGEKTSSKRTKFLLVVAVALLVISVFGVGLYFWLSTSRDGETGNTLTATGPPVILDAAVGPSTVENVPTVETPALDSTPTVADASVVPTDVSVEVVQPNTVAPAKVKLVGIPAKARITFADERIRREWIEGQPGTEGWLVVKAEGFERYRRKIVLEPDLRIDLSSRLVKSKTRGQPRRDNVPVTESPPESPPSNRYIKGAHNTKIKAFYPPRSDREGN